MRTHTGVSWAGFLVILLACADGRPVERMGETTLPTGAVRLPDRASHTVGGWDASDPYHVWSGLTDVDFLDDSTLVYADEEGRVVAVGVGGEGRWMFTGQNERYGLTGSILVATSGGKVVVAGEIGHVVLDAAGAVVRASRFDRPKTGRRSIPFRTAASEELVVFIEISAPPSVHQRLHLVRLGDEPPSTIEGFPDLVPDVDATAADTRFKRRVRVAARGDLFAYSVSGDSAAVIRHGSGGDTTLARVDFPIYGPMIDADGRVWLFSWEASEVRPSARVFSAQGEPLFDYFGTMPNDAIGDRVLILRPAPEDPSLLVIEVYDAPVVRRRQ